jgi:hypothetical protein
VVTLVHWRMLGHIAARFISSLSNILRGFTFDVWIRLMSLSSHFSIKNQGGKHTVFFRLFIKIIGHSILIHPVVLVKLSRAKVPSTQQLLGLINCF